MPTTPAFASTTKLVARALAISPAHLQAGLRTATGNDLDAILAFRHAYIGDQIVWDDAAYLRWRYHLGNANAGFGDLWLLELAGRIAGIVGTEKLQLLSPRGNLPALRTMDILVDPALHSCGLGVWLNQCLFQAGFVNLAVGANPNSIGTVARLYDTVTQREEYIHALDFRRVPMGRFRVPGANAIVRLLGNPVMRVWRLLIASSAKRLNVTALSGFKAEEITQLTGAPKYSESVDILRSADLLNRRAFDNPRGSYRVFAARREQRLVGYVIWKVAVSSNGDRWAYILDIYAQPSSSNRCVAALMAAVIGDARKQGCSHISFTTQRSDLRRVLSSCGFFKRKANAFRLVGFHTADPVLSSALKASSWKFTEICSDQDGY